MPLSLNWIREKVFDLNVGTLYCENKHDSQKILRTDFSIKAMQRKIILLLSNLIFLTANQLSFSNSTYDLYGDYHLHNIERQLKTLCLANQRVNRQSESKIQKQFNKILDQINNPNDLAIIAIWCYFNSYTDELERGFVGHSRIVDGIFYECLDRITKFGGKGAQPAIEKIMHQVSLDGHRGESIADGLKSIGATNAPAVMLFVNYNCVELERFPLKLDAATYRFLIQQRLWHEFKNISISTKRTIRFRFNVNDEGDLWNVHSTLFNLQDSKPVKEDAKNKVIEKAIIASFKTIRLPKSIGKLTNVQVDVQEQWLYKKR